MRRNSSARLLGMHDGGGVDLAWIAPCRGTLLLSFRIRVRVLPRLPLGSASGHSNSRSPGSPLPSLPVNSGTKQPCNHRGACELHSTPLDRRSVRLGSRSPGTAGQIVPVESLPYECFDDGLAADVEILGGLIELGQHGSSQVYVDTLNRLDHATWALEEARDVLAPIGQASDRVGGNRLVVLTRSLHTNGPPLSSISTK